MKQENQIYSWAHMLDEAMNDKAAAGNTSFSAVCGELGYDGVRTERLWEKAADVVDTAMGKGFNGDIEAWDGMGMDEFVIFGIGVSGHAEFDGIGAYEYWGQKCYDKGSVYIETDEIEYSEDDVLNALAELGMSAELQNADDADIDWDEPDEDYGTCSGTVSIKGKFVVTDKAKFAEWASKQI